LIDEQSTLIAGLHVVTTGDQRGSRVPRVVPIDIREPVDRPVCQSSDIAVGRTTRDGVGTLLGDANQTLSFEARDLPTTISAEVHAEAAFEEQPVVERRGPLRLCHAI